MKFILQENQESKPLSLQDVEDNQFFVNLYGCLCQKVGKDAYLSITNDQQEPWGFWMADQPTNLPIKKILPEVVKIEF